MIAFEGVSRRFPGVQALCDVSFEVKRGECHALVGENGAGKSTLGKILAGLVRPDSGRVLIDGREVRFHSPRDAASAGVGIVHQELVFCPNLTVAENLCLHDLPRRGLMLDVTELRLRARGLLSQIGLEVDVDAPLGSLSVACEQMVQIAAALGQGARVLVLDEPTSALGQHEAAHLAGVIRRLVAEGTTVLYVSHRLDEIFDLCVRVTVLRDGRHVATRQVDQTSREELVRLMAGRAVAEALEPPAATVAQTRLRVRGLESPGRFGGIDFEVASGEIVGLAGLVGAGRSEIARALFGLDPHSHGVVEVDGQTVALGGPRQALESGISLIPEDRGRQGLILDMNVRENVTLSIVDRFCRMWGRTDLKSEAAFARSIVDRLSIRTPGLEAAVRSLSGGNQQKIVFSRGPASDCRVLIVDEPTRGVDVAAKREIHDLIAELAARGTAIVMISSDLPELLRLSHRVLVLRAGRIVARLSRAEADPAAVVRAMTGVA